MRTTPTTRPKRSNTPQPQHFRTEGFRASRLCRFRHMTEWKAFSLCLLAHGAGRSLEFAPPSKHRRAPFSWIETFSRLPLMAMLFAVPALLAVTLGIAQGSDTSQCAVPHSAAGGSLLQHAAQSSSSSNPFASHQHAGCRKMIHRCLCKDCEDEAQEFYHANWSAWKLGFDICCNSQYNEELCHELNLVMFNFPERAFGPGDLVKETPDPALKDFASRPRA